MERLLFVALIILVLLTLKRGKGWGRLKSSDFGPFRPVRVLCLHLYLPLDGFQSREQVKAIANMWRRKEFRNVLVPGGVCFTQSYKHGDGEPVFSPRKLREMLVAEGVPRERIIIPKLKLSPWAWIVNSVSSYGEVKWAWKYCAHRWPAVSVTLVGVKSHMKRSRRLWNWYGALMRLFFAAVVKVEEPYKIVNLMEKDDPGWTKREAARAFINLIDPLGIWVACAINMLRRWQVRGAYNEMLAQVRDISPIDYGSIND